jgi:peptidoglycan/LPS O-acetylase OafA/YrhL
VAAICLTSFIAIFLATRIKRFPLPSNVTAGIGGITYPLYLLHQQIGYTLFVRMTPTNAELRVIAIILGIGLASWILWRYVERPLQTAVRRRLTGWAARLGMDAKTGTYGAGQSLS